MYTIEVVVLSESVLIKDQPKKNQINAFESFQIDWIDELIRRFQLNFMSEIHSYVEWIWSQFLLLP